MNITLAIVGALLIAVAAIRGMMAHNAKVEAGEIPVHGSRRIVKVGEKYWVESYAEFPSWIRRDRFDTLEAALEDKAAYDKIRAEQDKEPEVVK